MSDKQEQSKEILDLATAKKFWILQRRNARLAALEECASILADAYKYHQSVSSCASQIRALIKRESGEE